MSLLDALGTALMPPLCLACGSLCRERGLCGLCLRDLDEARPLFGPGPAGVDSAWSSAPHDGVARQMVVALKYRRLTAAALPMASRIYRLAPGRLWGGEIVPVPAARARSLLRGFDPAGELAAALAERAGAPLRSCLRRSGGGRQVGRRRAERIGRPPRIEACGPVPRSVLLVDDVLTTGATIAACAAALRAAGASRVAAVTFVRRL